ncbi:hypothetical protein [Pseudomonas asiatica]|uniref:hypothetical protein n=1 Tax=Pseudomonas asiatica TaxID=2219225 RepID=UPI0032EDB48A
MVLSMDPGISDAEWGCSYHEVAGALGVTEIKICFVNVRDLSEFSKRLTHSVLDDSWMTKLDKGSRRQYDYTVKETAGVLVDIFNRASAGGVIGAEFGELMVSIGSARALERIFSHARLPIAELWKPQVKQNEGFDFHTVCTEEFINFGEAKFSAHSNPHGNAISQIGDFLSVDKHFRDRGHLEKLVKPTSIANLDDEKFGVVAAFSINSENPLTIFTNALKTAVDFVGANNVAGFYLVGVSESAA